MIRKLLLAFVAVTAAVAAVAAAAAAEPGHPRLKAQAVINSDIVRIGDLVENAGIVAKVPIFRAPDLGFSGTVTTAAVVEAVRPHALIGLDTAGLEEVTVTRASRTIAAHEIEATLAAALSARFALGPANDVVLTFDRDLGAIYADPEAKGTPRVLRANYDARSAQFDVLLEVPGRAPLRLTGRALATVEVAVATRSLVRGDVIKHADVSLERRPRGEVGRDIVTDRERVIGLAARGGVQPGQILRTADLMKPEVVQRNEAVTLIFEVPGITLTVRGKALEAGAEGDTISVLNEQSKRTIQGVVAGPSRVIIGSSAPRLAANIPPPAAADAPPPALQP